MFAIMAASYFYLRGGARSGRRRARSIRARDHHSQPAILLVSIVPMHLAAQAAEREDLPKIRLWLIVSTVLMVAFLASAS